MFATSSLSSGSNKSTSWICCGNGPMHSRRYWGSHWSFQTDQASEAPQWELDNCPLPLHLIPYLSMGLPRSCRPQGRLSVMCYLRSSLRRVHYVFLAQRNFPCRLARWVMNLMIALIKPVVSAIQGNTQISWENFCTYLRYFYTCFV